MNKPCLCTFILCCLLLAHQLEGKSNRPSRNRGSKPAKKSSRQARSSRCKNKTTFSLLATDLGKKPLNIKCPKGPIADVHVMGVTKDCRGYSPFLRMRANRCAWNATCSIPFQGKGLDEVVKGDSVGCLGKVPEKLEISYTCLKKKAAVTDVMGQFVKAKKRTGILRSHRLYPWSYRNGERLGNVTFIRPRKPAGLATLWFTVHSLEILDSDLVFLSWEGQSDPDRGEHVQAMRQITFNDTTFSLPDVRSVTLTFYADYNTYHTNIGGEEKGFIFCYQWLKAGAKPKKGSVCNRVLVPAKCRNKKSGAKGRRKSGNSRSKARKSGRGKTRSRKQ